MPRRAPGIDAWGFPIPNYVVPPVREKTAQRGPESDAGRKLIEGLRALSAERVRPHSLQEIAEACGCTEANIRIIERRAMRKLKTILNHYLITLHK